MAAEVKGVWGGGGMTLYDASSRASYDLNYRNFLSVSVHLSFTIVLPHSLSYLQEDNKLKQLSREALSSLH